MTDRFAPRPPFTFRVDRNIAPPYASCPISTPESGSLRASHPFRFCICFVVCRDDRDVRAGSMLSDHLHDPRVVDAVVVDATPSWIWRPQRRGEGGLLILIVSPGAFSGHDVKFVYVSRLGSKTISKEYFQQARVAGCQSGQRGLATGAF